MDFMEKKGETKVAEVAQFDLYMQQFHAQPIERKLLQEILMANVFQNSIASTDWIKSKSFAPHGVAANYSFLYFIYLVLHHVKPQSILELGIGQTSRLTSQYIAFSNQPKAKLYLVDNDANWIQLNKKQVLESANIHILHLPIEEKIYKNYKVSVYKNLCESIGEQKFDFIIHDGHGFDPHYSRTEILDLIEKHLVKSFVIIMDNVENDSVQETAKEVLQKLDACHIDHWFTTKFSGRTCQLVIGSKDLSFLELM